MNKKIQRIQLIGVPSDLGANMAGALMGPAAIRSANLHQKLTSIGCHTRDLGDIQVPIRESLSKVDSEHHHLSTISTICSLLATQVQQSLEASCTPLILGGDHSLSIGSIAGVCNHFKDKKIGLVWIDTHADINTPQTSPSGNIHGMPISVLLGNGYQQLTSLFNYLPGIQAENIVLIGLRDVDEKEKTTLKSSGVNYYTMRDVDERGLQKIMRNIKKELIEQVDYIHVSFDLDVMDPTQVPGVSTPVPGGFTIREAHLLLEILHETEKVCSADFVELNPYHDVRGQSARLAVDLICSLFGKSII